jgi:hypothetical protein
MNKLEIINLTMRYKSWLLGKLFEIHKFFQKIINQDIAILKLQCYPEIIRLLIGDSI